jgi:hypothetical protein
MNKEEIINKLYNAKEKIFSFVNEAESLLNRVILFSLLIIFLIWINFGTIIDVLVSESRIKSNLTEELEEATGKKAEVAGEVEYKNDPEPIVIINDAKIKNDSSLTDKPFFRAQTIKTKPNILKAIAGSVDFDNIYFEDVEINIDSNSGGGNEVYGALQKVFSKSSNFHDKKLLFKNLQLNFYKKNPLSDTKPVVKKFFFPELELNPDPETKAEYQIKGSIDSKKFQEVYFFDIDIMDGFGKESAYEGKIYSTDSELKLSGKLDTKDKINFYGKLDGKFNGFSKKLLALIGMPENSLESVKENDESQVTANFLFDGKRFNVNDFRSDGSIISFTLNSKTDILDKTTTIVDINVDKLEYSQMFKSEMELLSERKAKKIERDFKKKLEEYFLFATGDDVNFLFSLNVPKINFFHNKTGSLFVRAALKNNQFRINMFKAKLPGETTLNFVGVAEINKEQKQLKGASRIVFAGKNMDELMLALDSTKSESDKKRFGPFYIDSKGFLYGQNIHLREIVARINDDKFAGQMLIDYSKEFNASAAFNFTSLNIDKYIETDDNVDLGITQDENALASKLDFLRVIDSIFDKLDISLVADNMVKAGQNYRDVSVFAQVMPGVTEIKDIYFNSEILGEVSGKAHLDLTDFQPKINVDLNIDEYDMDLMTYGEIVHQDDKYNFDGKWSNEKVTFEKLGSFQGNLNLKIDNLKFYHFLLTNFVFKSHAEEGKLVIDESRADLFGNKIDFKGSLTTEYPSFNISFVASDLDSEAFMSDTFAMDQIDSTFNMSGVLTSTGYSIEQMIQNLKGNLSVATKGFKVSGFDLKAVGKALPLAKRREYVKLISDELLSKGVTEFSYFSGRFYVESGQITFRDLNISSPNVRQMRVSGVIDLPQWKLDLASNMDVITSDNGVFNLTGQTSGTIPDINTVWDNKGMAKYWEDRFFSSGR